MAGILASYKAEDINLFRLRKITSYASTKVLKCVFQAGTKGRKISEPLFTHYCKKGVPLAKFKGCLNKEQIDKIEKYHKGSTTFDVTLLFKCIQWGNDKVENKNHDKWKEGNDSLESHLTAVKNRRNELYHNEIALDNQLFFDKTEDLRKLLTKTLELAGQNYGNSQVQVNKLTDEINKSITCLRDKPLIPMNFADYKRQNFFIEQSDYIRDNGTPNLRSQYQDIEIITPGTLLLNMNFKVKNIYIDMVLVDQSTPGTETAQSFEELLNNIDIKVSDPVLLVEGFAGVGKTTLTKKILCDWATGKSTMKNLTGYDLLLYAECRSKRVPNFKTLVDTLMPTIAQSFKDNDLMYVVLDQKVVVVIDGLDELTRASTELFKEVLELKKIYGITVIVTTRPEKVVTYYDMVNPLNIQTKHIKLIGIPEHKIGKFARQYHAEMRKNQVGPNNINSFLHYLKQTANRLGDLWLFPYNLILLIIVWALDPSAIHSINTASELYWKIKELIVNKLRERLVINEETGHLSEPLRANKIEKFMMELCSQALLGLANDDINLPESSYKHLEQLCIREKIPANEMIGAFMKKVVLRTPHGFEFKHCFPHKGFQEFLGAKWIFQEILTMPETPDVKGTLQDIERALSRHNLPQDRCSCLIKLIEKQINEHAQVNAPTVVKKILENMHKSEIMDIRKYQNLLITLIGMFYLEKNTRPVSDSIKLEVLELLVEAGIRDWEAWLRVLNTVRCDKYLATFVSKQQNILEKTIRVTDGNIFAYVSLMKALTPPLANADKVNVEVEIKGETIGVKDLFKQIQEKDFKIKKLMLKQSFRKPTSKVELEDEIISIFERYPLEAYMGGLSSRMQIPDTIKELNTSLFDATCATKLNAFLQSKPSLRELGVCMSHSMDPSLLIPLPDKSSYMCPSVCITDIKKPEDIVMATAIIKNLQPIDTRKRFYILAFPACELDPTGIQTLLRALKGSKADQVELPYGCKPTSTADVQAIHNIAENEVKITKNLLWKHVGWYE